MKRVALPLLGLFFVSCGSGTDKDKDENILTTKTTWYIQLKVDEEHPLKQIKAAKLYDIDLFDTDSETIKKLKEDGKIVICYFSAGSYEDWRPDKDKFPKEAIGNPLEGWEGEYWLDIKNDKVRRIMADRIKLAKKKGCDGVDPDNVDGYENDTGFDLAYKDQLEYNRFLAKTAHNLGLLIGLKNDLDQIKDLVNTFDFSVNEECHQIGECDLLMPFVKQGKPVFNIEYDKIYLKDENFKQLCEDSKRRDFRTLVLSRELDGSLVKSCDY